MTKEFQVGEIVEHADTRRKYYFVVLALDAHLTGEIIFREITRHDVWSLQDNKLQSIHPSRLKKIE